MQYKSLSFDLFGVKDMEDSNIERPCDVLARANYEQKVFQYYY
jgi:hypothetical protein